MALDTFVAGRYAGAYNAVDVGITEGGFEVSLGSKAEMVNQTDAFGESLIDGIFRGGECEMQFQAVAYKAGSISPFWPWGGGLGSMATPGAPIAQLFSNVAQAMVLSSTANTPAATSPASLTASKSILAPNNPAKLLFNSTLRKVPVRLAVLPVSDGTGGFRWFSMT